MRVTFSERIYATSNLHGMIQSMRGERVKTLPIITTTVEQRYLQAISTVAGDSQ